MNTEKPEDCNLVAVHDGRGESATWLLTVEKDGEMVAILAWPKGLAVARKRRVPQKEWLHNGGGLAMELSYCEYDPRPIYNP